MPEPPLLLADRVVGLDAAPGSMGTGTIWTETDVGHDSWYLHQDRMPAGILIESGQADLMLISYLGVDWLNAGERVYRLLGCELTYHGALPAPGETLRYDIHVDGHAAHGDVRLFFFHYDCRSQHGLRLTVRKGQAGFFTDAELADSAGVLWTPEEATPLPGAVLDPPVAAPAAQYSKAQIRAFSEGRAWECFGESHVITRTHTRTPRIQSGDMCLMDRVTSLETAGGAWGRGHMRVERDLSEDDWFLDGHFKNDPCMPGTLMFEGCLQAMAFYLAALGFTIRRDGWRFEPTKGEPFQLRCRGQATPSSRLLVTELFVHEVVAGPEPRLVADLLCTVDGLKAFHAERVGLELLPAWPLDSRPQVLDAIPDETGVASADGFPFGYQSLLACAWGRPSEAFGPMYSPFDSPRRVARLPGPPYHFMSRVTHIDGPIGVMKPGARIELEYDIPPDAWYFDASDARTMPFCVFLEAVLQPCGWLASFVGSALSVDRDLSFRNLDGTGTWTRELFEDAGTLRTAVEITKVSHTAGMIIETFAVEAFLGDEKIYEMETVFGFFPPEALARQVGLPTSDAQRAELTEPCAFGVDLKTRPARYCTGSLRLPHADLLTIDRITGFWSDGGEAGLGRLRAEKDVDASAWSFKAHFFQDPVQPGSLGIEALLQLLRFYMLETGAGEGMSAPRFEPLQIGAPITWKYRGQVIPENRVITTTLEITGRGSDSGSSDDGGEWATARGSLWVDGKRIYQMEQFGIRVVDGDGPDARRDPGVGGTVDPETDAWLADHRPTFTVPAVPMMAVVDALASRQGRVVGLRDVQIRRWWVVTEPSRWATTSEASGPARRRVTLTVDGETLATALVELGTFAEPPSVLPALKGALSADPYAEGRLFHGPAMQTLTSLRLGTRGASATLRADIAGGPDGALHPVLLDGATHAIPHDRLHLWDPSIDEDQVAYPARIPRLQLFGPAPRSGTVRCEVRYRGQIAPGFPAFRIQLITDRGVWVELELIEALFPKGPIGRADPLLRRAFLQGTGAGPRLSRYDGEQTRLSEAEVAGSDWLPGTVAAVYGTRDTEQVAIAEHIAGRVGIHPGTLPEALPINPADVHVARDGGDVLVTGPGAGPLDLSAVRDYWNRWFGIGRWLVEDLYYGLCQRFIGRVVLADPQAFEAVRGSSLLYLGNHQTGVESLLFSIVSSALAGVPTVTLAKAEHRETWLGRLIAHCFAYPGVEDPRVITFFDRQDKSSLVRIIAELAEEMAGPGRGVMVHVEGTRALTCREPVRKMSGAFIDMALKVGAPIVPVRFVGGLPVEPLQTRLEFPTGLGTQDLWFGRPLHPEELAGVPYGERKRRVIDAINSLGPGNDDEAPSAPDSTLATCAAVWQAERGVCHEHAVLAEVLRECPEPCAQTRALLGALDRADSVRGEGTVSGETVSGEETPADAWLAELARRLGG